MKKRILAALLALIMLFGALPMSVFAEDLETVEEPSVTYEPDEPEKYTYHLYYDFNYVGTGSTKWNIEYGPTADTSYTYTVDSQTLTCREGYNFLGWADGKNATEPDYRGGDTITLTWQNPTKTIYAVWEKQPQPDITDPTEFIGIKTVPVQCDNKADHYMQYAIDGLIEKKCAELVWSTGSKEATLKLYPEKIAKRFSALKGTHTAVSTSVVTVTLAYNGGWKIDGAIPVIYVTCAAPEIPDPTEFIGIKTVPVQCNNKADHYMQYAIDGLIEKKCAELVWSTGSKEATLKLYPEKIANRFSALKGTHTAVTTDVVTVKLTYSGGWKIDGIIPVIYVTCAAPEIPDPTDSVKDQFVTVVCDDKTAHPNIHYLLENLPAGSVDVQRDGAAKTAKLVLKPDKIAEHYGMAYGVHTAVNPADVEVSLTYVNDAWSLSAAIPDVHVTCKPAQEIPNPKDSFNKLLVNVACNTENSGHDPIEVPLSAVANSVNVRWEPGTATAYITLTPSIFATYYSQHNNGANGAHDPVAPAAVTVEAHYDNEKGWFWTKPTINVKCEPVYTITYNWRGVVKPADVKNVNNPGTFTADELPITLKAPDFKNNEWPQKFLNWRDAAGNVVTQITEPGNVELYAYYQFPVKYTVYDENDQKVDELSVTEWYNEDAFAAYSLRSGEKTGHDFDGWYQTTKDFGNTNKRVTELYKAKKWELVGKLTRKEYTVVAKMYLDGAPHFRQNTDFYTYQVTGLYGDPINFASIKEQAIAQAEKDRPASASYDASVIEDWAGNATCTTFGEHQPDLDTPHYVNVHVNTTQHVYVYRMIDGKMEATEYHHSTAPFGANVVEHLNANVQNLDMPGYSHDEWFKKDVPALDVKFGDTDTINGWTNVVIKYTKNEFPVTYDYACTDPALVPNWKVWATLPENKDTYTVGQKVTTAAKPDDVDDGEYIWKFITWKLGDTEVAPNTQVEMVAGGLTFVGIWERTQKEYGVTYSYDPSLPDEVQATLPKNPDTYTVGQKVTTAAKPNSVRVGEYIWTFKTWKLDGVEVAPNTQVDMVSGGLHFEGIWQKELIHYSLTIQYVDKKGKELAESHKDLLAKGEAYKVDSPKIKGYKLKDKDDAVIEGTMPGRNLTIEVVYIKKSTGGGSGTIDSPNKPTTKAPALTLNTDDHFAFINGYPDGSVQPEGNVTRAETAAILYRIMGDACQSYYKTNSSSYSDVARGDWYNTYVATLENAGVIVDTRTNGKFRPNDAITRAELASMIAQFAGLESASAAKFNDVGSRYWAAEEIAIAAKMGWINGYPDGSFRPDRNVTRAELMAMVNRALGRTPKSEDDLLSGMKTWRDNANVNAWYYLDVQEATNDHTYTKSGTHETWKKLL